MRPRRPGRSRPGPSDSIRSSRRRRSSGMTGAGGATVVAAYSPRVRPGAPVSFPVRWEDLDSVAPADFTLHSAPGLLKGKDVWAALLPAPQRLPDELVADGHAIPIARVQAMHEG